MPHSTCGITSYGERLLCTSVRGVWSKWGSVKGRCLLCVTAKCRLGKGSEAHLCD